MYAILERLSCKQDTNEHFGSDVAEEGTVGRLVWLHVSCAVGVLAVCACAGLC